MNKKFTTYWRGLFGQAKAILLRLIRDKTALFFTFLFPLIFLFVFGTIFNNHAINFNIGIVSHTNTNLGRNFLAKLKEGQETLKIHEFSNLDQAKASLKNSKVQAIVEIPRHFGELDQKTNKPSGELKLFYEQGSEQTGNTLLAIFEKILANLNTSLGHPKAPFSVEALPLGETSLTNFDYTFTGLLAFSLMNMSIFGLSHALPSDKQKGIFKRLRASNLKKSQLILSHAISYCLMTLLSLTTMTIVGLLCFGFKMRGDWLLLSGFMLLSSLTMVGIGLLIGGWAENENQATPLSNIVAMPMMFLSGTFIPTFIFPDWLKVVSSFIPVTPIVDGARMIMTENANLFTVLPQIGIISLWGVVIYLLAIKLFRWD